MAKKPKPKPGGAYAVPNYQPRGGGVANPVHVQGTPYTSYGMGAPPASTYYQDQLTAGAQGYQPAQTPGENTNPTGINSQNRSSRGGGGGGGGGPDPAQIRAMADQLFGFNVGPYDLMRQNVGNQRTQAQGYNPDFAGMQATYNQGLAGIDATRAQAVQQRLQDLVGFGNQLGQQQTSQMRCARGPGRSGCGARSVPQPVHPERRGPHGHAGQPGPIHGAVETRRPRTNWRRISRSGEHPPWR